MALSCPCWFLRAALLLLMLVPVVPAAQHSAPLLSDLFQDHAVLQREAPIRIWGQADPGDTVTVVLAGETASVRADAGGRWSVLLPALPAGGPHTLSAWSSGGASQSAVDVLIGDVFLCSGQSNMALTVSRALDAPAEIASASHDRIRMLTVGLAASVVPQDTLPGEVAWQVAAPETVADWSAVCYFFARELQRTLDVPIGLVTSAWGGSNIRAWMSPEALSAVGGDDVALALLHLYRHDPIAAQRALGGAWQAWWRAAAGTEPWRPEAGAGWPSAPEGLGDWKEWGVPGLENFYGMMWHRASFNLTAEQADQDAVLSLGSIDEVDQTWINGHVVGNTFGWGTERTYPIPADLLREGENVVVVNVLNTYGHGGMAGDPERRALLLEGGDRVALDVWRYQPGRADVGMPPRAPWESVAGLSTIHNAMVAPLDDFGLRAVLWYQGESNTSESDTYLTLLKALMAQWRTQFRPDLPVLIVQLANYGAPPTTPGESGWAEVREAQRLATRTDPRAGLAVTIDIGTPYDIHPPNKQEVGRRLALEARNVIYGEPGVPTRPTPASAGREDGRVVVRFDGVEGGLVAYGNTAPIGFELCGAEWGTCRYADARIEGARVLLQAEGVHQAARIRYCWADSPICTLYGHFNLPVEPFELHVTQEQE